jgi:hypothetical protein
MMHKSIVLDQLLENAVAVAIGVAKPHPYAPKKLHLSRSRPSIRRHHPRGPQHREHVHFAA